MLKRHEKLKCEICGNIVEIIDSGSAYLKCCEQKMEVLVENTVDAAVEKHIPVVEKTDGGVIVKVGEVEHPMTDAHYIQWIEILEGEKLQRQYLSPSDKPEAVFKTTGDVTEVRAYCNLHGNWKA